MAYNRGNSSAEVDMGKIEESGIRPVVIKEIIEFAKKYGLKQVILFG